MCTTTAWWRSLSSRAVATTVSPNTSPHSAKPRVAGVHQLEEQVAAAGDDRQVADLVDDQELGPAQEAQPLAQRALALGLGERAHEVGQGGEVDAPPGLHRLDAQRQGEVGLTAARLAEEVDDLV